MVDGNTIATTARANLGKMYNSINSAGGTGYYTSTTGEPWCADFAKWVGSQAGVDVDGLTPRAISCASYGELGGTPQVGDGVVFDVAPDRAFAQHVAIVIEAQPYTRSLAGPSTLLTGAHPARPRSGMPYWTTGNADGEKSG
jgi:hypothetical protein